MSQEDSSAPNAGEPPRRIRRFRIGANVAVQIALGLVLFGFVNYLGARHFRQWDFTYNRNFTLADSTKNFLQQLKIPVRVTVLTIRDSTPEKDISSLLDQYRHHLRNRLSVEIIDTRRDVQSWENFKASIARFKLHDITENGILVQAAAPSGDPEAPPAFRWIREQDLYEIDPQTKASTAFKGESLLNAAIRGVTDPERPVIGIVSGFQRFTTTPDGTVYDVIADVAARQNIEWVPFRILEELSVPENLTALLWVGPLDPGPRELEMIRNYLETPPPAGSTGRALLVLLNPAHDTPRLDEFLSTWGIAPQRDRILYSENRPKGPVKRLDVDVRFHPDSQITEAIAGEQTILTGQTRSLKLITDTPKQKAENIQVHPVLQASEGFWGEMKFMEPGPRFDEGVDNAPPLYAGLAAERGASTDPRVQLQSSRLLVFGNSVFLDPPPLAANYDLLTRSMNWILHRDVVAPNDSTTDKARRKFRIHVKQEQWQRIFATTAIVLPLAALLMGVVAWSSRRS